MEHASSSNGDDCSAPHPHPEINPLTTLGQLAEKHQTRCLALAVAGIRRYRLKAVLLAPEDAVNDALLRICRRIQNGTIPAITTSEAFEKAFPPILEQFFVDQWRHEHAAKSECVRACLNVKREGNAIISLEDLGMLDSTLDVVDRRAIRPDERVMDEEQVEKRLRELDRDDASLREVLLLRMQGFSNADIAAKLDVSISTIKRKRQEIQWILEPHIRESG